VRFFRVPASIAVLSFVAVACASFSGADGDGSSANDAGSAGDGTTSVVDGGDAAATPRACGTRVILGTTSIDGAGVGDDQVPASSADAYGFVAATDVAPGTAAACARVYVSNLAMATTAELRFRIGVYADEQGTPGKLLAQADRAAVLGWNEVALNAPVLLPQDKKLWIAVHPLSGSIDIRPSSTCTKGAFGNLRFRIEGAPFDALPDPFGATGVADYCAASMYLTD
jgi:hypothetical protein